MSATTENPTAERAILGAILADNAVADRIAGLIEPADFSNRLNGLIFQAALAEIEAGRLASAVTLRPFVLRADLIIPDGVSPVAYLQELTVDAPSIDHARAHALHLLDLSARRKLELAASDLATACKDANLGVSDVASIAVSALDEILASVRPKRRSAVDVASALAEVWDIALEGRPDAITTGLSDLDRSLGGGWRRKQFAIIAGRPSMGKTTLAIGAAKRTAEAGHGVMFFSLEMPTHQLAQRIASDLAWTRDRYLSRKPSIAYKDFMAGTLSATDLDMVGRSIAKRGNFPLVIDDDRGLSIAEISARIRAQAERFAAQGKSLDLVVIDHIGFIKPSKRYAGQKVHEVAEISDGLATIAKKQNVAIVALHQLNRQTEGRDNKRPQLSDLRNSGDLEQDADVVLFTYRDAYYLERQAEKEGSPGELARQDELQKCASVLEVLIGKNRNGPTKTVTLFCDMAAGVVRSGPSAQALPDAYPMAAE